MVLAVLQLATAPPTHCVQTMVSLAIMLLVLWCCRNTKSNWQGTTYALAAAIHGHASAACRACAAGVVVCCAAGDFRALRQGTRAGVRKGGGQACTTHMAPAACRDHTHRARAAAYALAAAIHGHASAACRACAAGVVVCCAAGDFRALRQGTRAGVRKGGGQACTTHMAPAACRDHTHRARAAAYALAAAIHGHASVAASARA